MPRLFVSWQPFYMDLHVNRLIKSSGAIKAIFAAMFCKDQKASASLLSNMFASPIKTDIKREEKQTI